MNKRMNDTSMLLKRYGFPSTTLLGVSEGKLTLEHRQYSKPSNLELALLANTQTEQLLFAADDLGNEAEGCTRWLKVATNDLDRANDTLDLSGIVLENFARNPQLLWMHGLTDEPIHTIGRIRALSVSGNALFALAEYASHELSPLANQIEQLERAGFLPANSIGFHPIEWEANDAGGLDFLKWELIECSKVELPMNPFAINDPEMDQACGQSAENDSSQTHDLAQAAQWLSA
jgi:hypothetical protein